MKTSLYQLSQAAEAVPVSHWSRMILILVLVIALHLLAFVRLQPNTSTDSAMDVGRDGIVVGIQRITQPAPPPPPKVVQPPAPVTPPAPIAPVKPPIVTKKSSTGSLPTEVEQPDIIEPKVVETPPEKIEQPPEEIIEEIVEKPIEEVKEELVEKVDQEVVDKVQQPVDTRDSQSTTESDAPAAPEMVAGGGDPAANIRYVRRLTAWLERHKRYPSKSRRRGEEGTVVLNFEIDRSGKLQSYNIVRASTFPALNAAVEQMIKRASPLPKPPADMKPGAATVSFTVPVNFSLGRR